MLKPIFFFFTFAFASSLFAQTSAFVEVSVQDTLQLEPEEIIYTVGSVEVYPDSVTTESAANNLSGSMPSTLLPNPDPLLKVREIIQAMHLDTLNLVNYTVSNNVYYRERSFVRIRFRLVVQLKEFTSRIQKIEGIAGSISSLSSSKEKAHDKILLQRLYNQAKMKAEALAQIAGKKLGSVLSIKEQPAPGGWTMYPPLSTIPGWHTEVPINYDGDKITLRRQIVVQFNWN